MWTSANLIKHLYSKREIETLEKPSNMSWDITQVHFMYEKEYSKTNVATQHSGWKFRKVAKDFSTPCIITTNTILYNFNLRAFHKKRSLKVVLVYQIWSRGIFRCIERLRLWLVNNTPYKENYSLYLNLTCFRALF